MHNASEKSAPRQSRALFIDRDDTIIRDACYLDRPEGVVLLPGARRALQRARRTHRLFLFSNQSGIGRGYYGWEQADAVNARMFRLLGIGDPLFDAVCMAPESPGRPAVYRKPSPRFILECIDQFALDPDACWMVGDRLSDIQAGLRAGIRAALVTHGNPVAPELADYLRAHAVPVYPTLGDCVAAIQADPAVAARADPRRAAASVG
ncbi:MAG: HAD-IIIA family hydrolase [Lentisphaerae bacterium]|nr:HAD-IIIA family hydrolase [Lentisphaerota bacterium]